MRSFFSGILVTVIAGLIVFWLTNYVFDAKDSRGAVGIYETRVKLPYEIKEIFLKNIEKALKVGSDNSETKFDIVNFISKSVPSVLQQYFIKNNSQFKSVQIEIKFDGFMWAVIDGNTIREVDTNSVVKLDLAPDQEITIIGGSRGDVFYPVRFSSGGRLYVSTKGYYYDNFKMETPSPGVFSLNIFVLKNITTIGFIIYILIFSLIILVSSFFIYALATIFSSQ